MDKILFNSQLTTGNEKIDDEHHQLIDLYNKMVDLLSLHYNTETFVDILSEMSAYAYKHFADEEKFMTLIHYPKFDEHKKLHIEYLKIVSIFNANYLQPGSTSPKEVLDFLGNWWVNHILNNDMDYIKHSKK